MQLIEYLLTAPEFIIHQTTTGACRLEVKLIDYLLTSLEFITHRKEVLGHSTVGLDYTGRPTFFSTSGKFLFLVSLVLFLQQKNFQKSGDFGLPSLKDRQCLYLPNQEGTYWNGANVTSGPSCHVNYQSGSNGGTT